MSMMRKPLKNGRFVGSVPEEGDILARWAGLAGGCGILWLVESISRYPYGYVNLDFYW